MHRYLVTGGAGFIGAHLVHRLAGLGHHVRVLDDLSSGSAARLPPGAELIVGDACDLSSVDRAARDTDGIFHLAAIASVVRSVEDWVQTHTVNQTATVVVLEAARQHGNLPVVFASSAAIYGDQCPATEELKAAPQSPYGADKAGSELHLMAGWRSFALPSAAMRFFNVFGPWQNPGSPYSGVISAFLARAIAERPLVIHGDGGQSRDFIYVADVVRFLHAAMNRLHEEPTHFACNVSTGRATSIQELAETIGEIVGRPIRIDHGPGRAGDIRHSRGDTGTADRLLGIAPETTMKAGLQSTMRWMRAESLRAAS
jgi:UDP-glucose 4-epimerase